MGETLIGRKGYHHAPKGGRGTLRVRVPIVSKGERAPRRAQIHSRRNTDGAKIAALDWDGALLDW